MKKAAAYARVSTTEQSKTSIDGQLDTIRNFAKFNDIKIVEEFWDKESGGKMSRPNFDIMIENAFAGKYDLILVEKIDRFAREDIEATLLIKQLEDAGIFVMSVLEPADVTTPSGRFQRWIMLGFGKLEREIIADRTKRRMRDTAKRGYWMGGIPPYGYKTVEVKDNEERIRKKLEIVEEEAKVIRKIFELHADGKGLAAIADYLNNKNILTRKGKTWAKTTIYDILRNKKYIGIYEYGRGTKKNHHAKNTKPLIIENVIPPIIDDELWEKSKSQFRTPVRISMIRNYLLRGKIYCAECGAPLVGNGGKKSMYVCSNWKSRKGDHYVGISKNKIEKHVFLHLKHLLIDNKPDFREIANTFNYLYQTKKQSKNKKIKYVENMLNEKYEQRKNIIDAIKKGVMVESLTEEAENIEKEIKRLKLELERLMQNEYFEITEEELEHRWNNLTEMILSDDEDTLKELYDLLIERIEVASDGYIRIINKELL
ncbi:hypothetical protein LN42_01775 [Marinitoga sp. 1137]|uniref:recombinase family protein n=1 Tax=Marinitoga sp. 1137 TaxID=1545835 RepID=UPI0009505F71|nr:recombinase family protein [Marinitoga sp. 1137]APT75263.1 hypothetical protein LN42_01775 [Marinitoga sp. 1137]